MAKSLDLKLDRFGGLYLLGVFVAVFGVLRPHTFLTTDTVHLLASSQAVNGLVALAVLVPLICGQYDLSVGANANFIGMVVVLLQNAGAPVLVAIAAAVAVGLLIGVVNGFVVVKWGVNSFIATLGMGSILVALQTIVTGNQLPNPPPSDFWTAITQQKFLGFQLVIVYLFVAALFAWWILEATPIGRAMMATGSNPEAARLAGIRTERWSWISFIASGGLSALAGVLFVSLTGPSISFGPSLVLPAFAAAFLGSTQFKPGRYNVWGTILAIFVLATGVLGLQLLTSLPWINDMFNGVAVISAVALSVARRPGRSTRTSRRRGPADDEHDTPEPAGLAFDVHQPLVSGEG